MVEETQKTAHYTLELDEETDLTIEQLIDEGRLDRLVFDGRLYELQGEADPESKGGHIGFIGETYYVDQEGKRWTEDELKNPYLYLDPKDIREKNPMTYGSVYRHKGEPKGSSNRIIIELNRKVLEAELVREE
ncbi:MULTISPECIES: NisI/SpaI family lantibiotic immunity lipoprotein [Paenibacillus]|uniref:NisI/SpaI family lantibiotic immunity lipoprotein n=1 Tax=Paenibacillus TaxID=44249 RepID=UPI0016425B43|nr:NisI/SpaI family lantibiotic immunity lipoprotein [Paenibacillus sp. IHBB 10380]